MQSLIFVNKLGKNSEDTYTYEFYFSEEPEMVWGEGWDYKTASLNNIETIEKQNYDFVKILKTKITFDLSQRNSCFSMQDMKDGIIPVAWENIDGYEEYPEDGRIVFPFGVPQTDVELTLSRRDLVFEKDVVDDGFDF
jgi:hypothetical protein